MISLPQQSGLSKVGYDLEFLSISLRNSFDAGAVWTCVREFLVRVPTQDAKGQQRRKEFLSNVLE